MFLPVGDASNPKGIPFVTYALIALNVAVFQTSAFDLFSFEHGYRPAAPQAADLLSCMFLHGSFVHLFGNMLFLWIYGDNVERRLGVVPYLFVEGLQRRRVGRRHAPPRW